MLNLLFLPHLYIPKWMGLVTLQSYDSIDPSPSPIHKQKYKNVYIYRSREVICSGRPLYIFARTHSINIYKYRILASRRNLIYILNTNREVLFCVLYILYYFVLFFVVFSFPFSSYTRMFAGCREIFLEQCPRLWGTAKCGSFKNTQFNEDVI